MMMTFAEIVVDVFKKMTFRDDVYMPSVREGAPGLPKLHAAAQGILVFALTGNFANSDFVCFYHPRKSGRILRIILANK